MVWFYKILVEIFHKNVYIKCKIQMTYKNHKIS